MTSSFSETKGVFCFSFNKRSLEDALGKMWRIRNISKRKQASGKKTCRTLFKRPKQNCIRNLKRFWQSSILRKIPNALFPPNPSIFHENYFTAHENFFMAMKSWWWSKTEINGSWKSGFLGHENSWITKVKFNGSWNMTQCILCKILEEWS